VVQHPEIEDDVESTQAPEIHGGKVVDYGLDLAIQILVQEIEPFPAWKAVLDEEPVVDHVGVGQHPIALAFVVIGLPCPRIQSPHIVIQSDDAACAGAFCLKGVLAVPRADVENGLADDVRHGFRYHVARGTITPGHQASTEVDRVEPVVLAYPLSQVGVTGHWVRLLLRRRDRLAADALDCRGPARPERLPEGARRAAGWMPVSLELTRVMATLSRLLRWVEARIAGGWRVVGSRWRVIRGVAAVGLLVVAASVGYQRRAELSSAAGSLGHLRVGWVAVAVAAEIASMVAFGGLHRWLLRTGGVDVSLLSMIEIVLAGNALSSSLPGGAAWSATWSFGQFRRRGADPVLAGWVVVVSGVVATAAVCAIVIAGTWAAGGTGPVSHLRWSAALVLAVPAGAVGGYALAKHSPRARTALHDRTDVLFDHLPATRRAAGLLRQAAAQVATVRPGPLGWIEAFGFAMANWLFDALCLAACIEALGLAVPWRAILVIYGLTQVAASLPITPGGLGVVEASLAALLVAYGEKPSSALAVVLLYRVVSFWGLVPIGWVTWFGIELAYRGGVRRRAHPWADHLHGANPPPPRPAVGPERILRPAPCFDCPDNPDPEESYELVPPAA
jgi:putative heme transporter